MPKLFTYGTLQRLDVQLAVFGRQLQGVPDSLTGYRMGWTEPDDGSQEPEEKGKSYPILREGFAGTDAITGTVYEVSAADLQRADAYEGNLYCRIELTLTSGLLAWVYVDANQQPDRNRF